ncbi:Hypothetical protein NTJ_04689 [Nesidiocoris tenuis]|uniref:Uncharacterized protein n=1 Tax=Nesidiocoris tenuis TaxID=355587 RepID=A0ABN7AI15_9HEMI|nr:Hypothetical protein NTJ_04689 [Nesidiocoris tenuis]
MIIVISPKHFSPIPRISAASIDRCCAVGRKGEVFQPGTGSPQVLPPSAAWSAGGGRLDETDLPSPRPYWGSREDPLPPLTIILQLEH